MSKFKIISMAAVVMTLAMAAPANAKECQSEPVIANGKMKLTKIMAYPSSLFAWRRAVDQVHGPFYHSWRRAEERNINCAQVYNGAGKKRWQCTRTARPCAKNGKGNGNHNHGQNKPHDGGHGHDSNTHYDSPSYPGYVLRSGSSGKAVTILQHMLDDAGYHVELDGDFGQKTKAAVRAFQRTEAIQVDGAVGRETWNRLAG